jgi:glutaminase-like protein
MPPPVTPQRAQQLFSLCNSRLCCPASCPPPCIPFLYPDDGCWARAHEMCRLMIADGAQPEKVWIYGTPPPSLPLKVSSQNKSSCLVEWNWHVAPTLEVSVGNTVETWVIDPSLFPGPVSQATWAGVQGDPNPILEASGAAIFHRSQGGGFTTTDPMYVQTNADLATYRNLLKLRCAGPDGPPPYFACMTKPPRVQWFGSLAPNQTHTWFTWGWGAKWHVFWTIMPLTPCPGGPQLRWRVQVERANATQCTYWITVTNLTSDPVKFEGRYDVLSW